MPYNFARQRGLGKWGEKQIKEYLKKRKDTIEVFDSSEIATAQPHGVDFVWLVQRSGAMKSILVDVKMDMLFHRTGNLFIETKSSKNKDGCLLTSSSELFLYFDPFGGHLFFVEIEPLRNWFEKNKKQIKKDGYMKTVKNEGYESEGFVITPELLSSLGFCTEETIDLPPRV